MYQKFRGFFCDVLQIVSIEAGNDGKGVVFRTKRTKSKFIFPPIFNNLWKSWKISSPPPSPQPKIIQRATSLVDLLWGSRWTLTVDVPTGSWGSTWARLTTDKIWKRSAQNSYVVNSYWLPDDDKLLRRGVWGATGSHSLILLGRFLKLTLFSLFLYFLFPLPISLCLPCALASDSSDYESWGQLYCSICYVKFCVPTLLLWSLLSLSLSLSLSLQFAVRRASAIIASQRPGKRLRTKRKRHWDSCEWTNIHFCVFLIADEKWLFQLCVSTRNFIFWCVAHGVRYKGKSLQDRCGSGDNWKLTLARDLIILCAKIGYFNRRNLAEGR